MAITKEQLGEALQLMTGDPATRKAMRDHLNQMDPPDTTAADAEAAKQARRVQSGLSDGQFAFAETIKMPADAGVNLFAGMPTDNRSLSSGQEQFAKSIKLPA